ncbi:MAG: efflux RND transporter periplasmic adaptor subunit [Bacteroidota bacterium]|nr:efflux RND transporter periplasmic adaptor subunit [Bacteroidota bacterium]
MRKKNINLYIAGIVLISCAIIYFFPFPINYFVESKGLILPAHEWSLIRSIEGNLISSHKDNIKGSVQSFGVTEFVRGDVVEFKINNNILSAKSITTGDTVGMIYSNEQERNLIQLLGDFEVLNAEYKFYTTGQKPEDIQQAKTKLEFVKQDLLTQKKLTARAETLYKESVISDQEYELALNDLKLKEIQIDIAEALYNSVSTGDKPEMAALIKAKMQALEKQINQVKGRFTFFTVTSPVSGMVVSNRALDNTETVINVADTSSLVILVPFDLKELPYVKKGQEVYIGKSSKQYKGKILNIDNVVQVIDYKQAIFATIIIDNHIDLMPGSFAEVSMHCGELSLMEYLKRIFDITF